MKHYIITEKILESMKLLSETDKTIAQIAEELFFSSQSHFTEVFRKQVGATPLHYRKNHPKR